MKRTKRVIEVFTIATVLLAQPGCAMLVGPAVVAVGQKVYEEVKDDAAKKDKSKQE